MTGISSQIEREDLALAGWWKRYFGRGGALGCFSDCSVLAAASSTSAEGQPCSLLSTRAAVTYLFRKWPPGSFAAVGRQCMVAGPDMAPCVRVEARWAGFQSLLIL